MTEKHEHPGVHDDTHLEDSDKKLPESRDISPDPAFGQVEKNAGTTVDPATLPSGGSFLPRIDRAGGDPDEAVAMAEEGDVPREGADDTDAMRS